MLAQALDSYFLEGKPDKATLVKQLLAETHPPAAAQPYLEGLRVLGARTPDLALIALRLALAGRKADDETVVRLRDPAEYRSEFA